MISDRESPRQPFQPGALLCLWLRERESPLTQGDRVVSRLRVGAY